MLIKIGKNTWIVKRVTANYGTNLSLLAEIHNSILYISATSAEILSIFSHALQSPATSVVLICVPWCTRSRTASIQPFIAALWSGVCCDQSCSFRSFENEKRQLNKSLNGRTCMNVVLCHFSSHIG